MPRIPDPETTTDDENPEWTVEDFARARPASELPDHIRLAFPKTAAALSSQRVEVTLTLGRDVVSHYQSRSENWRTEIESVLREAMPK